jgi:DNA-binding MarR family transcriptional regulator
MELRSFRTLQILEAIAEEKPTSQRELSVALQISLGLVNSFIKRLVKKGYCKITTVPRNRVKYMLTPSGAMEKTRLTYQYISTSYQYFQSAQKRLRELYRTLQEQEITRVVFYGAGEVADIAYLSMTGTQIQLIAVIDPSMAGKQFAEFTIGDSDKLETLDFDVLLITAVDQHASILDSFQKVEIPEKKIRFI